ncbi:hypothetical protein IJ750_00055 [bacterium]|nr:hypothetical protein [bacterium]
MKVQQISQQQNSINEKQPQFKGAVDSTMRYLATNQAVGANGVDLAFMVTPRTASDSIRRGPVAGLETARREMSGTVNHTLVGAYGIGAGALVAALMGIDRKYGTKVNKMMAAPETINILAENKAKNMNSQKQYLTDVFNNLKAFNPASKLADADGYIKLSKLPKESVDEFVEIMNSAINNPEVDFKKWSFNGDPEFLHVLSNKITEKTGAQSKYILESAERKDAKSVTNLNTILEDIFRVSRAFDKPKVKEAFEKQISENKTIAENDFVKKFTKYGKRKSIAGFIIASGIGMSIQPINMYLTKKKTGQDGFVGVEGRTKDTSTKFKILKTVTSAAFFGMVLTTLKTGIKGFMDKMAFTGFWPTISQLKGIYGVTIISRFMSARDTDELREAATKDTLGFLSWLVLGDFVNKIVAEKLDKSVMNRTKDVESKGFWGKIFNSSLKTRDEVLIDALASKNQSTTKIENGKVVAKKFKELLKDLNNIEDEQLKKAVKKRLRTLNRAQAAGYIFSGTILGLGIPNLNIYITNKLDKKRKEKAAMLEKEKSAKEV